MEMSNAEPTPSLKYFGFLFGRSGPHTARTLMLDELSQLLEHVSPLDSPADAYRLAIIDDNCLAKKSGKTRELTYGHLRQLYGLNPTIPIFRVLLYFWKREREGHALLAALCALSRDAIFRRSQEWVSQIPAGEPVSRESVEAQLSAAFPDRYSPASLKSIAQNLNSSWTKTGHLRGRREKFRQRASPTPASTAYALYLGYLTGLRGEALFYSAFCQVLEEPPKELMDKGEAAARRGWIVMKRLGNIVEVAFPNLVTDEERRLLHEQ